jgi:hypothetical protein
MVLATTRDAKRIHTELYCLTFGGLDRMDSFTIAVLIGGGIVVGVLGLMIVLDKGKPAAAPAAPTPTAKASGKR